MADATYTLNSSAVAVAAVAAAGGQLPR